MSDPVDRERVASDEERARAILEQLKGVHAFDIARDLVIALVNFSSPKLGLSDETQPVRDLDDVRVSIELIRAILDVVEREHDPEGTRDLHDTLAQLQLAYGHAVQLANAERAAVRPQTPAEAAGPAGPADTGDRPDAGEPVEPATRDPEAEKTAAKKPAARKTAAKKPAARKTVAKKRPAGTKKDAAGKKPAGES